MSSRNLAKPIFPLAPQEYSSQYMDALVQSFAVYLEQTQNAGEGRSTKSVMTNAPTSPTGLEVGTMWNDNSIVRIGGTAGTFTFADLTVTGTFDITGTFQINSTDVTSTAAELNYLSGVTPGTVSANKAIVAGTSNAVDFGNGVVTNIDINSGSIDGVPIGATTASTGDFTDVTASSVDTTTITLNGTFVTATGTELNYLSGVTPGTAATNEAVVLSSSGFDFSTKNISGSNFDINGGSIDNTPIGATTASTGNFSTLNGSSVSGVTGSFGSTNFVSDISLTSNTVYTASNPLIEYTRLGYTTGIYFPEVASSGSTTTTGVSLVSNGTDGFVVSDVYVQLPQITTTVRDAMTAPPTGAFIFNSTTSKLNFYDGTAWREVTST